MKHDIAVLISFLVFIGSLLFLFIVFESLETDYITIVQAIKRGIFAVVILGIDAVIINILGLEELD